MASKKYKNKMCVYCVDSVATTPDHVFCREFFLHHQRDNLPKVPACTDCNQRKSVLEHYLTAVLPLGGRHRHARDQIMEMVPDRMVKNHALQRQLSAGAQQVYEKQQGVLLPTMTLPFNGERLQGWFVMIVRGLIWHHFKLYLPPEYFVQAFLATAAGEQIYERNVSALNCPVRVHANLGDGTFEYEGVQATDAPTSTAWRITALGGVRLAGDPRWPDEVTSKIIGFSAHRRVLTVQGQKLLGLGDASIPPHIPP